MISFKCNDGDWEGWQAHEMNVKKLLMQAAATDQHTPFLPPLEDCHHTANPLQPRRNCYYDHFG